MPKGPFSVLMLAGLSITAASLGCGDERADASASGAGQGGSGSASSSAGVGAGTGDPVATWCDAVGDRFCEALFACCTDPRVLGHYGATVDACKAQWAAECAGNVANIEALVESGASQLDTAQLAFCVSTLESLAMGGAACTEPPRLFFRMACVSAFRGQVPAGEACVTVPDDQSFVECAHGLCSNGSCEPFKKQGEPCAVGNDFCDYTVGLWCHYDGTTATCAPRGEQGAPCAYVEGKPTLDCKSMICEASGECGAPTGETLCAGD